MGEPEREAEPQESIDAIGLKCPEPVMLLHAAMHSVLKPMTQGLRGPDASAYAPRNGADTAMINPA